MYQPINSHSVGWFFVFYSLNVYFKNVNLLFITAIMSGISSAPDSKEQLLSILSAYRQAVDQSVISSITDVKGRITFVNERFCEVSKYTAGELIGQDHNIIRSDFHSKGFFREMWRVIANGGVWHGEIKNKAKDGGHYWVDSVIVPIKNNQGKPIQYLSLRTLISERKAKEEKSHEAHVAAIESMLFKVSHEVRQPVAQILGLSELMEKNVASEQEFRMMLSSIRNAALALDSYTRELALFMNKIKNS